MSEQQHNGHSLSAPIETGATVPPHPQMYDVVKDEMRPVAQEDYDLARRHAEEGGLRNAMFRRLMNMDLDGLRKMRKLIDENFKGPPKAGEFSVKS